MFENYDLESIITPVNIPVCKRLLERSNFDREKSDFLLKGFTKGFSLEYEGPTRVRKFSPNLKLVVDDEVDLWNKVMKEVQLERYVGPYLEEDIPFRYFIQSPIGLVPKDNGKDMHLIFHLSYPRSNPQASVNGNTPKHKCTVAYPDFNKAIELCLLAGVNCRLGRSDMRSAFRNLAVLWKYWKYLLLKAKSPVDGKWYFFVDKCIPFGHCISCKLFQTFSDSVAHIVSWKTGQDLVNYLDDYLFIALLEAWCNQQLQVFLDTCKDINFPVSLKKDFLGIASNGLFRLPDQYNKSNSFCAN